MVVFFTSVLLAHGAGFTVIIIAGCMSSLHMVEEYHCDSLIQKRNKTTETVRQSSYQPTRKLLGLVVTMSTVNMKSYQAPDQKRLLTVTRPDHSYKSWAGGRAAMKYTDATIE
jgi:hypothetical protein